MRLHNRDDLNSRRGWLPGDEALTGGVLSNSRIAHLGQQIQSKARGAIADSLKPMWSFLMKST